MMEIRRQLTVILDELVEFSQSLTAILLTEKGLILASSESSSLYRNSEWQLDVLNALSTSFLTMAERGVEIINNHRFLDQVKIDAGELNAKIGFYILISRVMSNLLLEIIYPKAINTALVQFEATSAIRQIRKIFSNDEGQDFLLNMDRLL